MNEISQVRSKWKIIFLVWFLVFIIGWAPIFLPSFSMAILKGLTVFGIFISILIILFWPRLEWYILLPVSQIISIEFLILSIRSMLFLPGFWAYIFIAITFISYVCIFFLPKFAPRVSYLIVHGNPESKLEKQIYKLTMGILGIAGACGAGIGIFGGRIYGMKILGVISPIFVFAGVSLGYLTFYNIWQKRPWVQTNKVVVENE